MKQIALLRGINVGGHRKVAMSALNTAFEGLGLSEVQTYIQSGNVVFTGAAQRPDLEAAIERTFGFAVPISLRSAAEWSEIIARNPYPTQAEQGGGKLHVFFLDDEPSPANLAALRAVKSGEDEWSCAGRELYLWTPGGLHQTKLSVERKLKVGATARNWRTVLKLGELAGLKEN